MYFNKTTKLKISNDFFMLPQKTYKEHNNNFVHNNTSKLK